jgi:hypothetical protein
MFGCPNRVRASELPPLPKVPLLEKLLPQA